MSAVTVAGSGLVLGRSKMAAVGTALTGSNSDAITPGMFRVSESSVHNLIPATSHSSTWAILCANDASIASSSSRTFSAIAPSVEPPGEASSSNIASSIFANGSLVGFSKGAQCREVESKADEESQGRPGAVPRSSAKTINPFGWLDPRWVKSS
ncbi:hypothetical protein DFJ73DRAFT_815132 [Zopfochytrium polystomum]|nr:hypothetical protein DFJ73DRAFT_815132 [Zopfochytrium polystomum]